MTLLSPRNVLLLGSCREPWERLEFLMNRLLRSGLMPPLALEAQCLELTRHEWEQVKEPFS